MTELNNIQDEIDTIDSRVEDAKQEKAEAEGAISVHLKQLVSDHGIKNDAEAREFIEKGKDELSEIEKGVIGDFNELKERCGL